MSKIKSLLALIDTGLREGLVMNQGGQPEKLWNLFRCFPISKNQSHYFPDYFLNEIFACVCLRQFVASLGY